MTQLRLRLALTLILFSSLSLAADKDQDGVTDKKDGCPYTPAGRSVNKEGCHFSMAGAIFTVDFSKSRAQISRKQQLALRTVGKKLAKQAQRFPGMQISVRGYKGPTARDRSHADDLSLLRALAVAERLKAAGLAAENIQIQAMGNAVIATNAANERRVDIVVLPWHKL